MAQARVDAGQGRGDAAQSAVDAEMTARANGYANNVSLARRELAEKKRYSGELREQQNPAGAGGARHGTAGCEPLPPVPTSSRRCRHPRGALIRR